MRPVYLRRWHDCILCGARTQSAIYGNRLLSWRDMERLPTDQAPTISWRCERHQPSQVREVSAVHASELGDVLYVLACGHEIQWIVRGIWGYTPAMIAHELATRQIRLDQPQRCYLCGDLESEKQHEP
jgi:hypothetical protein